MKYWIIILMMGVFSLGVAAEARADTLTLKDGQVLNGTLVERSDAGVKFNVGGQVINFAADTIKSIEVAASPAPAAVAPAAAAPAPVAATGPVVAKGTLPAGTIFLISMSEGVNSKQHKPGHKFRATLQEDLKANGAVVAPKGATLYGELIGAKSSGRLVGKSELTITFDSILLNDQRYPISTDGIKAVGEGTGKDTASKAVRGAAIGGLADGSDGAKTGAKVGLGIALLTQGNQIEIPAGALLEFTLTAPLTVK